MEAQEAYLQAEARYSELEPAIRYYDALLIPGTEVFHSTYGTGKITNRKGKDIIVDFDAGPQNFMLDFFASIVNNYLRFNDPLDSETKESYRALLKNHSALTSSMRYTQNNLAKYSDILE